MVDEAASVTVTRGWPWPLSVEPRVLYEDDDVVVVDKPAGLVCQATSDASADDDLPSAVRRMLAARRGVSVDDVYLGTHQRLDQDTSGAILYALRKSSNAALAAQFEQRSVEKIYVAAVSGKAPPVGTLLVHALAPGEGGRMRVTRASDPAAKEARTRVLEVKRVGDRSLLTLAIETGRTHQVRVQLAAAGCPVAGDALYGGAPALRLLLHAQRLAFDAPSDGSKVQIECPTPLEFSDWLEHGARPAFATPELLTRAIELAIARRSSLLLAHAAGDTNVYRLLNDAGDGVPGYAVDVYDRWLVMRVDRDEQDDQPERDQALLEHLCVLGCAGVYLKRHPKQANQLVDPTEEHVAPKLPVWGEPAPAELIVQEQGVPFEVRLAEGLRTGLFLDQRDNRARLRRLAPDKRVLNLFAYTGSFSVAALLGDAAFVTTVDASRVALGWADRNVARVGRSERHRSIVDDAFHVLARLAKRGERFDIVILDPPSYSTTKRGRFRALTDYGDLCAQAIEVLAESGVLLACINHHGVSMRALRRFVHEAARARGREITKLRDLPTARDFPNELDKEPGMKSLLAEFARHGTVRGRDADPAPERQRAARTRVQKTQR